MFVRHPKEEKTRNPIYEDGLPYVYGKVNAHHAVRVQRYRAEILAEKYRQNGVTVAKTSHYGVVLGVQSPFSSKSAIRKFHFRSSKWSSMTQKSTFRPDLWSGPLGERIGEFGFQSWNLVGPRTFL